MKAHKGSYVNKTNEKPVLRGEGEMERKGLPGVYCLEKAAPFTLTTGEVMVPLLLVPLLLMHYFASSHGWTSTTPDISLTAQ